MYKIKFGDIRINDWSKSHISECLQKNMVTMGPKVEQLETMWSKTFYPSFHTTAVNSGTSACMAACMTLYDGGAKPGDEIIVPGLSFIATATAVRAAGFTPVFVDIKKETLNIDESLIEDKITSRTVALMPVALMGRPPNLKAIKRIADRHRLPIILDACEAHGASYLGTNLEQWADITVYSCYAAHVLFSGELGFVCSRNKDITDIVKSIRNHGRHANSLYFDHVRYGLNLKPTDIHASIGLGNLPAFFDIFNTRRQNLVFLRNKLTCFSHLFWFSDDEDGAINSPHAFSITFRNDVVSKPHLNITSLQRCLTANGIEWKRNFGAMPLHGCFGYMSPKDRNSCPNAEYVGNNGLHFACHQYLSTEDLNYIVRVITDFVGTEDD